MGLSSLQSPTTTLTDTHLCCNSFSVMPAAGELEQLDALLWRKDLGVRQGGDDLLRGRLRQL